MTADPAKQHVNTGLLARDNETHLKAYITAGKKLPADVYANMIVKFIEDNYIRRDQVEQTIRRIIGEMNNEGTN